MRDRFLEAFHMATLAMAAHRMRTFLTMLGIIIGIASVVSVVGLGNGSRARILNDISALGTNTIDVYPGADFGDMRSGKVQTLRPEDALALASQSYVDSATPSVQTSVTARYGNVSATAQVNGASAQYFRVRGLKLAEGTFFDNDAVEPHGSERRHRPEHAQAVLRRERREPDRQVPAAGQGAVSRDRRDPEAERWLREQQQSERLGAVHDG